MIINKKDKQLEARTEVAPAKGSLARKLALIACLVSVFALSVPGEVFAARDLSTINSEKKEASEKVKEKQATEQSLADQIKDIEGKIDATLGQITALETEIATMRSELNILEAQIENLQKEIYEQNTLLNKRLRLMYETGEHSVIEVLLGSESIVDFLANLDMIKMIHKSDRELIEELDANMKKLDEKKAELVTVKNRLDGQWAELEAQRKNFTAQQKSLTAAKEKAHIETKAAMEDLAALEAEAAKAWSGAGGGGNFEMNGELGWPVTGRLTCYFGAGGHRGIDIATSAGRTVYSPADGVVVKATYNGSYGNYVVIDHGRRNGNSIMTLTAHHSALLVSPGQWVSAGQPIAAVGSTGNSTGPHVHFEVTVNGNLVNPLNYL